MSENDFDKFECAAEMLRMLNGGKSATKVRTEMKKLGYTTKQIAVAGQVLIDAY